MMKQYYIIGNMYEEEHYQQVFVRQTPADAHDTGETLHLLHELSGIAAHIVPSSCLEITPEEYNRLRALEGEPLVYDREAWAVISAKLIPAS
jgi:hypothetical protein